VRFHLIGIARNGDARFQWAHYVWLLQPDVMCSTTWKLRFRAIPGAG